MTVMFFRTVIIYILLLTVLRLMGKRQIGELQPSELVTTLLLSEIASQPITDDDIPMVYGIVPVVIVLSLEVIASYAVTKIPCLKRIFLGSPSILINKGKIDISEMKKCRISVEELMRELRENGIGDIATVRYCIMEENGKISVIQNAGDQNATAANVNAEISEKGICRPMVVDGKINKDECMALGHGEQWIKKQLEKRKIKDISNVFLLTCDDCDNVHIVLKSEG